MAFALSGSKITQTGTDADLSGLSAIAGVTTTTSGSYKVYDLGTLLLHISGTLSHDPDKEKIISAATPSSTLGSVPIAINSGGVYNYGVARTGNGNTTYSTGAGIVLTTDGANGFNSFGLLINNNGTLNWDGGVIQMASIFYVVSGGYVNQNSGTLLLTHSTIDCQFRSTVNGANVARLVFNDLTLDAIDRTISVFSFEGYETGVFNIKKAFLQNPNFAYTFAPTYIDLDISSNRSTSDYNYSSTDPTYIQAITNFYNVSRALNYSENFAGAVNGYNLVYRQVAITPKDTANSDITEFSYYAVDTNNGSRRVGVNSVDDKTANQVYSGLNVGTIEEDVLVEVSDCNEGATPNLNVDYRYDSDGTIPFSILAFGKEAATASPELYGLGVDSQNIRLLPDFSVSAADKATVEAYTEGETARKLYDLSHVYRLNNFETQQGKIVTRDGTTINAGPYDVVIDATAASVFAFDGSTVTVKATTFADSITSMGTVTTANGATITGLVDDSVADSRLIFDSIDAWTLYATSGDRDSNTSPVDSGTSDDQFRFNYVAATTYYLRVEIGDEIVFKNVTPTEAGTTTVDLSLNSAIAGVPNAVWTNPTRTLTTSSSGATLSEIEASTILAMKADITSLNDISPAEVNAEVDAALADYDPPTKAELDVAQSSIEAEITALNDITAGDVVTAMQAVANDFKADVSSIPTNPLLTTDARLDNLDATISSRLASASYTAPANADITAIKAKTDTLVNTDLTGIATSAEIAALNDISPAEVNAEVDQALADYDPPTKAELDATEANITKDTGLIPGAL